MFKTIKSNEINGFISAQMKSANSITFCGELPKNAEPKHIRIIGEVEVNGTKFLNSSVENFDGAVVQYHDNNSEIATVYFLEGIPKELLANVQNYVLANFEVEYIEVCPCCGR